MKDCIIDLGSVREQKTRRELANEFKQLLGIDAPLPYGVLYHNLFYSSELRSFVSLTEKERKNYINFKTRCYKVVQEINFKQVKGWDLQEGDVVKSKHGGLLVTQHRLVIRGDEFAIDNDLMYNVYNNKWKIVRSSFIGRILERFR